MVYDCFTFFNELDILELRLATLDNVVDKFIIVESIKTHSNQDKELYYENNKSRFKKYHSKIIHIVVSEFPEFKNSWTYENYQRNLIINGLENCKPEDLILLSDVDEIPDPSIIKNYRFKNKVYCLIQDQYYFFYNYRDKKQLFWLGGTKILKYKLIQNNELNEKHIKYNELTFPKYLNIGFTMTKLRLYDGCINIYNGGWHFSYIGGMDAIVNKIKAFSHQELNNNNFLNRKRIEDCLKTGNDVFGRKGHSFFSVKITGKTHPEKLISLIAVNKEISSCIIDTQHDSLNSFQRNYQLLIIKIKKGIKKIIYGR
jgi:beta-1,4-mannosyl-glycoprotein beta-1,4-N-acetylglucosaminyltransferase